MGPSAKAGGYPTKGVQMRRPGWGEELSHSQTRIQLFQGQDYALTGGDCWACLKTACYK